MSEANDRFEIAQIIDTFFDAFVVGPDLDERMSRLRSLFVPGAVITRLCGQPAALMDVDAFITPRQALLASDTFSAFREWPEAGRIEVYRDLAHWFGAYGKEWTDGSGVHRGRGQKSLQFIRTPEGWRIVAAAWDDEP